MIRKRVIVAFGSAMLSAVAAHACPLCEAETGAQVRAGIADENLPASVLATVLPFAVTAGVVAVVHFGWPRRGGKDSHGH